MFFANAINAAPAIQDTGKWILHLTAAATPTPAESGLLSADQFGGYAVTAVFTIINVLIAYLVLKHFVFKPIIKLLNNRRTAVMNELDEADKKTKEAQKLIDEANSQIERAKSDASTIVTDARVQAEKQSHTIVNAAQTEANHIVERASEDSKRMHNAMLDQMRDEVADLAVSIASKVVGSVIDEAHQKELNERIMDETLKAEVKKID